MNWEFNKTPSWIALNRNMLDFSISETINTNLFGIISRIGFSVFWWIFEKPVNSRVHKINRIALKQHEDHWIRTFLWRKPHKIKKSKSWQIEKDKSWLSTNHRRSIDICAVLLDMKNTSQFSRQNEWPWEKRKQTNVCYFSGNPIIEFRQDYWTN